MEAYEDLLNHTSTSYAPWYIIPADHKWFTRIAVVSAIYHTLDRLHLAYPKVTPEQNKALLEAKAEMENESRGTGRAGKKEKKTKGNEKKT
jgi:hypothetical protein